MTIGGDIDDLKQRVAAKMAVLDGIAEECAADPDRDQVRASLVDLLGWQGLSGSPRERRAFVVGILFAQELAAPTPPEWSPLLLGVVSSALTD